LAAGWPLPVAKTDPRYQVHRRDRGSRQFCRASGPSRRLTLRPSPKFGDSSNRAGPSARGCLKATQAAATDSEDHLGCDCGALRNPASPMGIVVPEAAFKLGGVEPRARPIPNRPVSVDQTLVEFSPPALFGGRPRAGAFSRQNAGIIPCPVLTAINAGSGRNSATESKFPAAMLTRKIRGGDSGGAKRVAADLRGQNGCRLLHRAWAQTTRACPEQLRRDVICRGCPGQVAPVFRHAAPGRANWDAQTPLVYLPRATRRGAAPDTPRRRSCFCRRKSPRPGRRRPNASSAKARGWNEILRQSPGGA
jgi:hypothetical protein